MSSFRLVVLPAAALLALSGCMASTVTTLHPASQVMLCPGASTTTQWGCQTLLNPDMDRDREASLAASPTDPATALVTWRVGDFGNGPRIFAALTHDGGATWTTTPLRNPAVPDLPGATRYAYDSIARFSPDGTAYVLYGGEYRYAATLHPEDRMTFATSKDGTSWDYHVLGEAPAGLAGPDYPDFAVAPDTGRIYVVAQMYVFPAIYPPTGCVVVGCVVPRGIHLWMSDDGGATWSQAETVIANPPDGALGFEHYLPRIEAGPGGLVLLTTNAASGSTFGGFVTASHDGGRSWGQPTLVHSYESDDGSAINDPATIWTDAAGTHEALIYGDGQAVVGYRSDNPDAGWQGPVKIGNLAKGDLAYLSAAAGHDAVWAQVRFGSDEAPWYGVAAVRWDGSIATQVQLVADNRTEGAWTIGDDYGAVAVGADGRPWMAWADPRFGAKQQIVVAHLAMT